jgi:hypothetical protein
MIRDSRVYQCGSGLLYVDGVACFENRWIASTIRCRVHWLIVVHCLTDDAGNPPYVNAGISSGGLAAKATKLS